MKFKITLAITLVVATAGSAIPAFAQFPHMPNLGGVTGGLGGVTGGLLGGGRSSAASGENAFFVDFLHARVETNAAQVLLARAFDLKDEITLLEAESASLSSGALDTDGYKKSKELSESVNSKIAAKMDQGAALSDEGRSYYQAAIPHLLAGTLISTRLIGDAKGLVDSAQAALSRGSMFEKVKLTQTVVTTGQIATQVPGFVAGTMTAYKRVLSYGQANKVPVPKDATDALGNL